jgi:hypothetical protein
MHPRKLGLSLAALMFVSPFVVACSGDDDAGESEAGSSGGSGAMGTAGPDEPSATAPDCPFTAEELSKALDLKLTGKDCAFTAERPEADPRISVTTDAAAENEGYARAAEDAEKSWPNFETLDVSGQGFVAWTEDDLNIMVGYLDNAGEYRYQVSALKPEDGNADDAIDLAEQLIELTVESRPRSRSES